MTRELIERADRLKVIGRAGVGVDNVDLDAATERGIIVANAPQSTVISAAEHTIGLLLALSRNIPQAHAALKAGRWERSRYGGLELAGKTLGLVGFGRIGQQVARRAAGLEMRVLAFDPHVAPDRFRSLGVERVVEPRRAARRGRLPLAARHADARRRAGMIGAEQLARAKDGVRHRERRPRRAHRRGRARRGAALRQGARAPRSTSSPRSRTSGELLELDSVIVTPHLAASTAEAQDRAGVIVAEQVAAALDGGVVTNAVNMPSIGAEDLEVLGPFLPLAGDLAALACELAGGNPERLDLIYLGLLAERDTRLLTIAALNGAFTGRVEQPVNYVNAPLLARERGIEVRESSSSASPDFMSLVGVTAHADGRAFPVAGTTIGHDQRRQLVRVLDYEIDVEARPLHALRRERRHAGDHRPARQDPRRRRR